MKFAPSQQRAIGFFADTPVGGFVRVKHARGCALQCSCWLLEQTAHGGVGPDDLALAQASHADQVIVDDQLLLFADAAFTLLQPVQGYRTQSNQGNAQAGETPCTPGGGAPHGHIGFRTQPGKHRQRISGQPMVGRDALHAIDQGRCDVPAFLAVATDGLVIFRRDGGLADTRVGILACSRIARYQQCLIGAQCHGAAGAERLALE